jgi:hypothetical protein
MPYGSGLSAQLGLVPETTVGTEVAPVTKFYELDADAGEGVNLDVSYIEAAGLKAGQGYISGPRVLRSRFGVAGEFTLFHVDRGVIATGGGMGLIWKHCLGSAISAPTLIASGAYKQIHVPGFKTGLALTTQVGRPLTTGTVVPFTWRGCKIPSWTFSVSDGALAKLAVTLDAWQQATATGLATAVYPALAEVFSFIDASNFKIGGTATTAAGETTIASGVAITSVCRSLTLTGSTPLANERYGLGNAGVKREQVENGIPRITGTLEGEWTSQAEFYDRFALGTAAALQLDFSKGDAGGGNPFLLSFILPYVKFRSANVNADGPDLLGQTVNFEAFSDGTNPVMQVKLVSTDTAL